MRLLLLVAFSLCVLVSFSSFASAACPAKAAMPAWEDGELLALAYQIEKDEYKTEASAQKLSWRHYDKSCNFKSEYSTNGVDLGVYYYDSTDKKTGHTEFQMMRDANFNAQAAKGGYMFIWSTQAPCVVGSASTGRKACSDEVPGFLQTNYPGTKFIFGFSARKFARHEYKAMVAEGLDTDWDAFAGVLTKKWKGSKNANLLAYNGDKKMTFNDWVELAFLETDAVTTFKAAERRFSLRNKLRKNKALAPPTPGQTTTSSSSQSSNGDEIPAHKKVLVAALEGGAKYPLSFVLGKEDGTIAKEVTQGLAVPTPLPPGAVYIAVFANPLLENVEQFFKLANSVASAGGRVNIVFKTTSPLLMPVSPAGLMDNQQKKTPLQKENLRLFTLLGSNHVPKRIWPSKAAAPAAPGAPAPPAPSAPAATAPTSPKATKGK